MCFEFFQHPILGFDIIYLQSINWCILTLGLRGMQKHDSNIQSKLMGLVEGLVISCLVLIISC